MVNEQDSSGLRCAHCGKKISGKNYRIYVDQGGNKSYLHYGTGVSDCLFQFEYADPYIIMRLITTSTG